MKRDFIQILIIVIAALLMCMAGCKNGGDINPRDYQIELTQDSIKVYDGERFVGSAKWEEKASSLDSIFLKDNL